MRILLLSVLLNFSLKLFSQSAPCSFLPTSEPLKDFKWEMSNPKDSSYASTWSLNLLNCIGEPFCNTILSPWLEAISPFITSINSKSDYTAQKGWRLIDRNLGLKTEASIAYFVLFNQERMLLRLFYYSFPPENVSFSFSNVKLSLKTIYRNSFSIDSSLVVPDSINKINQDHKTYLLLNTEADAVSVDHASDYEWKCIEYFTNLSFPNNDSISASKEHLFNVEVQPYMISYITHPTILKSEGTLPQDGLYPNPNEGRFSIYSKSEDTLIILHLYDLNGKMLFTYQPKNIGYSVSTTSSEDIIYKSYCDNTERKISVIDERKVYYTSAFDVQLPSTIASGMYIARVEVKGKKNRIYRLIVQNPPIVTIY